MAYVTSAYDTPTWNDTGFNPQLMPYQGAANPYSGVPAYTGDDIAKRWQNLGNRGAAGADALGQQIGDRAQGYAQNEAGYAGLTNQLYQPIWSGGGGYNQEQMANVLQTEGLNNLQYTPEMAQNLQMTDEERVGATGNPYAYHDPAQTDAITNEATAQSWDLYGKGERGVLDSADTMKRDLSGAANRPDLAMSADYAGGQQAALAGGANRMRGLYTDPSLQLDATYQQKGSLTDREVEQLSEQAGADVGAAYGRSENDIRQRAAAAGMNPLAAESLIAEQRRPMAGAAADAMTRARLEGRQAQIGSLGNLAQAKLGAGQYQAGLGTSTESTIQGRQLDTGQQIENTRLGAGRDISNRQMDAAATGGQAGIAARQGLMNTSLAQQNTNATRALENERWNQQQGTAAEGVAANRAANLATNRQNATAQGQQQGFNQNMAINDAASSRYQQAYAPWLSQQQEGRQAATGMTQYYGGQGNTATNQRIGMYEAGQQAGATAAQGAGQWENINKQAPGWWQKNAAPIVNSVTGAANASKKKWF